ncbi:MAG: hypothetical protein ABI353_02615 [Isosphaeraceae bacterium]
MKTIDVLQLLRERPGVILGRPSARVLRAFLLGFEFARKDDDPEIWDFSRDFNLWVRERFDLSSTQDWDKVIEFFSATEAEELALFWKLIDEFVTSINIKSDQ